MALFASIGITTCIIIVLAYYVLLIIANWKIFSKAGQGGWKSLIPIYNRYIMYKIAWRPLMFWINILLMILAAVFVSRDSNWLYLGLACGVASLVIMIMLLYKLAKSFGHGFGYTLGLIFFPYIFTLILGFSKDEYLGPQ